MLRGLLLCLSLLAWPSPPAAAAGPADLIFAPFDAAPLAPSERRLLQAALAASGDYPGPIDGAWTPASAEALAAYATREFAGRALNLYAGTSILGFLEQVAADGWDFRYLPDLDLSLALPLNRLAAAPAAGGARRWVGSDLTVLAQADDGPAAARHTAAAGIALERRPDRLVTAGTLPDGRRFYTRSDRSAGRWTTVRLLARPEAAPLLALAAGSIRQGPPLPWDLPVSGRLTRLVSETAAFLDGSSEGLALPPAAEASTTGTAFYLSARTLVTAEHVVATCTRVTLADGTGLDLLGADPELDVALLETPRAAPAWLSLAPGDRARLGQRVHAAGFPYYSIAGTSLHLTGGNVSALAGIDDDRRFFSFTAPVQPGNSGGPLIDASGGVLGLVVARLSEDFIVQETGSLPQNVNYALGETELAGFLSRHGVAPAPGGLGGFDMDGEGAPDGFEAAVVPIVCH